MEIFTAEDFNMRATTFASAGDNICKAIKINIRNSNRSTTTEA